MSAVVDLRSEHVWTSADLDELPEDLDWRRVEIQDGMLLVSPPAVPRHELLVMELAAALRPAVPDGFHVIGSAGIELGRSYRVPDVTVLAERVFRSQEATVRPADVLIAIEIESPSSITTDRITKPAQYAAAGILHYWRIETDPLRLHTYRLAGNAYDNTGTWAADEVARVTDPFAVEIDLRTLLPG